MLNANRGDKIDGGNEPDGSEEADGKIVLLRKWGTWGVAERCQQE